MSILVEINENLQKGRSKAVCSLIQNALAENADPKDLMQAINVLKKAVAYAQGNISCGAICGWLVWELR